MHNIRHLTKNNIIELEKIIYLLKIKLKERININNLAIWNHPLNNICLNVFHLHIAEFKNIKRAYESIISKRYDVSSTKTVPFFILKHINYKNKTMQLSYRTDEDMKANKSYILNKINQIKIYTEEC